MTNKREKAVIDAARDLLNVRKMWGLLKPVDHAELLPEAVSALNDLERAMEPFDADHYDLRTTITRAAVEYKGDVRIDGEIEVTVYAYVLAGEIEIQSTVIHREGAWGELTCEETDLQEDEEERAIKQLQDLVPAYLAQLADEAADKAIDARRKS